jgi:hypothetical protein
MPVQGELELSGDEALEGETTFRIEELKASVRYADVWSDVDVLGRVGDKGFLGRVAEVAERLYMRVPKRHHRAVTRSCCLSTFSSSWAAFDAFRMASSRSASSATIAFSLSRIAIIASIFSNSFIASFFFSLPRGAEP